MPPLLLLLTVSIAAVTCCLFRTPTELLFLINSNTGLATFFCALIYALCTATPIHRAPKQLWTLLLWYCQYGTWASRSLVRQIIHLKSDRGLVANPDIPKPSVAYDLTKCTEDRDTRYTAKPSVPHGLARCAGFTAERQCGHRRNKPTGMVVGTWYCHQHRRQAVKPLTTQGESLYWAYQSISIFV